MKWFEARNNAKTVNAAAPGLKQYVVDNPAAFMLTFFGTLAAFIGTYRMGWMNAGMALACGYMGHHMVAKLVERVSNGEIK
jgi:hypothetical protein